MKGLDVEARAAKAEINLSKARRLEMAVGMSDVLLSARGDRCRTLKG